MGKPDLRTRARFTRVCVLGGLAAMLTAASAAANGRFPRAQRLIQSRESPDVMALYGTYGLLVTRDAGASWQHVCEAATGAYAGEDSLLEIMAGERIVLRTDTGLARSDVSFCSYDAVLGSTSEALQDITRDSAHPDGLLALSTSLGPEGVFVSSLSSSTDGGGTFTPFASVPVDVLELGLTLDVGVSRPELVYISGFDGTGRGKLAKSIDRGQSFVAFPITGLGVAAPPYIAAVSSRDPDRVFVRTDELTLPLTDFEARETANDSLYFTPDAGQTWHRALTKRGKLYGFALSPDERWVLAGYGDPALPAIFVEPSELGLYRVALEDLVASPDAPPWERVYDRGVTCLRWTESGLFACVSQDQNGFELGRAPDASFSLADAAPFEGLLRLPEVLPLECPADSGAAACLLEEVNGWPATCGVLRAECSLDASDAPAGPPDEPGQPNRGAGGPSLDPTVPAGGSGSSSATAGGTSSAPSADDARGEAPDGTSSPDSAAPSDARSPPTSGSCSAVAPASGTRNGFVSWSWLCALLLAAVRRAPRRRGAGLLAWLALGACILAACAGGSPGEDGPDDGDASDQRTGTLAARSDCGGVGDGFVLGGSKSTPDGALTVDIVAAEPSPPLVGANSWTVLLSGADGEAITDASVSLTGWMPEHGHGLNAVPLVQELDEGRYQIQPIILYMPQLWELSVGVVRDDERRAVTFDVCVP